MKYHNTKTTIDNIKFASKAEASRYLELRMLLKAGKIINLKLQPRFTLLEKFTDRNGVKHQAINYVADFTYFENGKQIVEDVKGMETAVYKLKKKIFLSRYWHLDFREIK